MKLSTLFAVAATGLISWPAASGSELESALKEFAAYDYGQPKKVLHETRMAAFRGTRDEARRAGNETLLLAFVQSDAPVAARREACLWLGDLGSEAARAVLTKLAAEDGFADVARIALDGLKPAPPAPAAEPASSLGRFRDAVGKADDQAALLVAAIQGEDEAKARLAFRLIGEGIAAKETCAWLGANIDRLSEPRQVLAIHLMLQLNAAEKESVIVELSRAGQGRAKLVAVRNLGCLERKADMEYLDGLLGGTDEELAEAARLAMIRMPDSVAGDFLRHGLRTAESDVRKNGIDLIVARGDSQATEALLAIAKQDGDANRTAAIRALGRIGDGVVFPAILDAFVAAHGGDLAKDWQAAMWDLSRRQPDYGQALAAIRAKAAAASPEVSQLLNAMAKKLEGMKPAASLEDIRNPQSAEPRPAPLAEDPNRLCPGPFTDIVPRRFEVAAYLDCGPEKQSKSGGVAIECLNGTPYNEETGVDPSLSVHFAGDRLKYLVSGLDEGTDYIIGFTWWDSDLRGRRQSVFLNGEEILPDARAIAFEERRAQPREEEKYLGNATPARIQFALLPEHIRGGKCEVGIQKVKGPNAVNSELWILKRKAPRAEKQVLLVSGQDYPGHHWRKTGAAMEQIVTADDRIEVTICETPHGVSLTHLACYDAVFVHFKNYQDSLPSTEAMRQRLAAYVKNGGGMCLSHFACGAFEEWPDFVGIAGRIWNGEGHDKRGPFTVRIVDKNHPVTKGLSDFETDDELYFCLKGDPEIHLLCDAFSQVKKADQPQAIVFKPGKGRVFLSTLGHDVKAFDPGEVKQIYRQGTAWAAGL